MRQAGRSLPEYRALRAGTAMLESCQDPDLVTEITLQPVRRHGVDAAILFSDIVLPLVVAGVDIEIKPGVGPVVAQPVRSVEDVGRLPLLDPSHLDFLTTAVRSLVRELGPTPLIGFAGAPFTLASSLVEGGPSRDHVRTKALMHDEPHVWYSLMDALAALSRAHLIAQIEAGAQAVQLFDSWVGALSPSDYERSVRPWSARVLENLSVPSIHFGVGTGELLTSMRDAGGDAIGVDWRVPLDRAWERIGAGRAIQGNLDPAVCVASWESVQRAATEVLDRAAMRDGHVFNLGHGVLPTTPVEHLQRLVDLVHERTAR
jgi:uroporphyrinogen decarboxylase